MVLYYYVLKWWCRYGELRKCHIFNIVCKAFCSLLHQTTDYMMKNVMTYGNKIAECEIQSKTMKKMAARLCLQLFLFFPCHLSIFATDEFDAVWEERNPKDIHRQHHTITVLPKAEFQFRLFEEASCSMWIRCHSGWSAKSCHNASLTKRAAKELPPFHLPVCTWDQCFPTHSAWGSPYWWRQSGVTNYSINFWSSCEWLHYDTLHKCVLSQTQTFTV